MPDYRKLCVDLFGTDDVEGIKQIYSDLTAKNPRGAGRKRKFSDADVAKMQEMCRNGSSYAEIAKEFHTTKPTVGRYCRKI